MTKMTSSFTHPTRRTLLKQGGALVVSIQVLGGCSPADSQKVTIKPGKDIAVNAYLAINTNGKVRLFAPNPEVGQGVKTALPMIVAEELSVPWEDISVEMAPVDEAYGAQFAGGSLSVPRFWQPMRVAGAKARTMLVQAAALEWGVDVADCVAKDGFVSYGDKTLSYGSLVEAASALSEPDEENLSFKSKDDYTLLGKRVTGVDNEKIVTGQPLFGIDQKIDGMHFATYTKCPRSGGVPRTANLDAIKAMPGVVDAFILEGIGAPEALKPGVAIVATSTWNAIKAKNALEITWDYSNAASLDWDAFKAKAAKTLEGKGEVIHTQGDPKDVFARAENVLSETYTYPFLPHAPLEPQNCTAHYTDAGIEVWAPTQTPTFGVDMLAQTFGVEKDFITLHQIRGGGGFGRRLVNDSVAEAVAISKQSGLPIKLQWTREDDFTDDFYRPGAVHGCAAALDAEGKLTGFKTHFVTFSGDGEKPIAQATYSNESMPQTLIENFEVQQSLEPLKIPLGWWRAPMSNAFAFVSNGFLDEIAQASGKDLRELYLELLTPHRVLEGDISGKMDTGRAAGVIEDVTRRAGWGKAQPNGRGMGLGFFYSHRGYVAEVADVEVFPDKSVKVHKVWLTADVGPIINLSGAENQCQGSVVDGLSTLMSLKVDIKNGAIQDTNFDSYPMMRMPALPDISVNFIQSDIPPTGLGEPAFPPLAPAVCNAIFAATGERIRNMPLSESGYRWA